MKISFFYLFLFESQLKYLCIICVSLWLRGHGNVLFDCLKVVDCKGLLTKPGQTCIVLCYIYLYKHSVKGRIKLELNFKKY